MGDNQNEAKQKAAGEAFEHVSDILGNQKYFDGNFFSTVNDAIQHC